MNSLYFEEEIIKQLCDAMKRFHSNKGEPYDWVKRTSDLFIGLYQKAKKDFIWTLPPKTTFP